MTKVPDPPTEHPLQRPLFPSSPPRTHASQDLFLSLGCAGIAVRLPFFWAPFFSFLCAAPPQHVANDIFSILLYPVKATLSAFPPLLPHPFQPSSLPPFFPGNHLLCYVEIRDLSDPPNSPLFEMRFSLFLLNFFSSPFFTSFFNVSLSGLFSCLRVYSIAEILGNPFSKNLDPRPPFR